MAKRREREQEGRREGKTKERSNGGKKMKEKKERRRNKVGDRF